MIQPNQGETPPWAEMQQQMQQMTQQMSEILLQMKKITEKNTEFDERFEELEEYFEQLNVKEENIFIDIEVRVADSRLLELEISHVDRKVEAEHSFILEPLITADEVDPRDIEDSVKDARPIVPSTLDEIFAEPREDSAGQMSELESSTAVFVADRPLSHDESEFESGVAASDSRFDISAFHTELGDLAEVPIETEIDIATSASDTIEPRNEIEPGPGIRLSKKDMNAPSRTEVNSGEVRDTTQGDFVEPRSSFLPVRNYRLLKIWQTRTRRIPGASTASKDLICRYTCKTYWCTEDEYNCVRLWDPGRVLTEYSRIGCLSF
jgi:hypothetical protein